MCKNKQKTGRANGSFDPRTISTKLFEALNSDLDRYRYACIDPTTYDIFSQTQKEDFLKKVSFARTKSCYENAKSKFVNNNIRIAGLMPLRNYSRNGRAGCVRDEVLLRAREIVSSILGPLDENQWFLNCKHSNGVSVGMKFIHTDLEDKWTYPLSSTPASARLFERYLCWDTQLKIELDAYNRTITSSRYALVEGSRFSTVPKNDKIDRVIAIEPAVNMFFQQGLKALMESRLAAIGLDIARLQERHRKIVAFASVSGSVGTIDFSMASDCVSLSLCRCLLPAQWYSALSLVRSPRMQLDGTWMDLSMISTMGNATTFPLQTLLYYAIAQSCYLLSIGSKSLCPEWDLFSNDISVYGDDCILPSECCETFINCMQSVGFIINTDKTHTHVDDGFRESCGADYFRFRNVRPVYLPSPHNDKLSSLAPWLYTTFNLAVQRYIRTFGELTYVYDKSLFRVMFSLFRQYNIKINIVPDDFPDDSGLKIGAELQRFSNAYDAVFNRIVYNETQGMWSFQYCSFSYRSRNELKVPGLRYRVAINGFHATAATLALSRCFSPRELARYLLFCDIQRKRESDQYMSDKRIGGYVLRRGNTSRLTLLWGNSDLPS